MINFRKCLKPHSAHPCRCFVAALPCVPPQSHLCNSISVLQWALIDLFSRSTKQPAKSRSFFRLSLAPSAARSDSAGGTLFFSPPLSPVFTSCLSLILQLASPLLSFPLQPAGSSRRRSPKRRRVSYCGSGDTLKIMTTNDLSAVQASAINDLGATVVMIAIDSQ